MNQSKYFLFACICFVFICESAAQRYKITNGISLQGGITQFDILTDNFETKSNTGFVGGLTASVDIPHKWYNVSYNIQLSENNIDISARPLVSSLQNEYVEYKMLTAQLAFLLHVKIFGPNFTLDVGPVVQYNGKLELKDDSKEDYIITNYDNLLAEDISDISQFNLNGAVGFSAGFKRFKLRANYQYGFTNLLGKLNEKDLNLNNSERFEGNQSLLVLTAIVTF